jgi:[ribosomal protein S5]-alanine N-acetyltransferase
MMAGMDDHPQVRLRAFTSADLDFLGRLDTDPDALGPFEWYGFRDPRTRRQRWERDGCIAAESGALAVELAGSEVAGIVSWKDVRRGGPAGVCLEIGAALLPEHRGRGIGTTAHRLFVDYLLRYTAAHRLEAWTEGENFAEQRVLERTGFTREGVLHQVGWRDGGWRDTVVYGLLRT